MDSPASSRKAPLGTTSNEPTSPVEAKPAPEEPSAEGPESTSRSKPISSKPPEAAPERAADAPEKDRPAPVSITSPPSPTSQGADAARETPAKPLLASEALMEDLAPLEPSREAARGWCAAVGLGFAALGALPLVGFRPGAVAAAAASFLLGGLTLIAALARVSYRGRAFTMLLLGMIAAVLGLVGMGPAAGIAANAPALGATRLLAATALPAALLFRARYRAYAGARWLLGGAFALALPFIVLTVLRLVQLAPELSTAGAVVAIVVIAASLVGFMGKETTGAGTYVGLSVLFGLGTDLALSDLSRPDAFATWQGVATTILGSIAFAAAMGLSALGLFQILASRLSTDARRINLHAALEPSRKFRPPTMSDWSGSE